MTITPRQVDLVCQSAAAVDDILESFTASFYDLLFHLHPDIHQMFSSDPEVQARKLAAELRRIVSALRLPDRFQRQVRTLGARHAEYGAEREHYDVVGGVLLATFHAELGDAFTAELHDAWAAAWWTIASLMLDAGAPVAEAV